MPKRITKTTRRQLLGLSKMMEASIKLDLYDGDVGGVPPPPAPLLDLGKTPGELIVELSEFVRWRSKK
jgi:hypothetical protein